MTHDQYRPARPSRRQLLAAAGIAALGGFALPRGAMADIGRYRDRFQAFRQTFRVEPDPEEAERMIRNIVRGREPRDIVELDAPDIAENGAVVPVTIRIDCAMTEDDYPLRTHLIATHNPFPEVAKFHFTPAQGEAEVSLRCRMRETADLVAIADMSDGTVGLVRRRVNVTLGACS